MTGLLSKKLCNTYEEYEIFQEFVFHNLQLAVYQRDEPSNKKRVAKQVSKENDKQKTIREKFNEFENQVYKKQMLTRYPDFMSY